MNTSITKACCFLLVLVGINTGLIGILNVDLFSSILGQSSAMLKVVDILIGIAAIVTFSQFFLNTNTATTR